MPDFIVLSGLPASGKSSLARRLAPALGLPLLDKDDILEALFDSLGVGDGGWRTRLSRAADEVLRRMAFQTQGAVLVSWWRHPRAQGDSGTPTGWLSLLPGRLVEVYCACEPRVAAERYLGRTRHEGHLDHARNLKDLIADLERSASLGPLGLGEVIRVETGGEADLEEILREIRSLRDHR
jgi:hypothetical protein